MTLRRQSWLFFAAAFGLWLLFFVQAVNTPIVLDDWFQLRYWRDHEFSASSLWAYARHNYHNYNPRLGEVLLAVVDGSRTVHLILTPLVQLAALPIVFVIALGRWPRPSLRDLQLLLFIQTMIWLVIPIPGIMYFYRPFATNYLWAFTITLALFVPYRLALASDPRRRHGWLVPVMLVLGWAAGMCNEHTGPTAMVAMAGFVYVAWRLHRLRAWMLAGMLGLYVGYPMLFFAPGQAVRYGGLATRDTPAKLLADRGVTGCLGILRDFIGEARLALLLFVAAIASYVITRWVRRARLAAPPRRALVEAGVLALAAAAIVITLFMSPTVSDRVFYASGVLLVAAFACIAQYLFTERVVRRFVLAACGFVCAFHAVRFVEAYVAFKTENDARLAIFEAARPGSVVAVSSYRLVERSRWHFGDDFVQHPWLGDYVGGELFDLERVDLDRRGHERATRLVAARQYSPPRDTPARPLGPLPTYRELQTPAGRALLAMEIGRERHEGLARFTVRSRQRFDDPRQRPIMVIDWAANRYGFVDGAPHDEARGHFIRVRAATVPTRLESTYVIGCGTPTKVDLVRDGDGADPLIPVDERFCRGPFTAIMCEPDRCWVAGWY